MTDEYFAKNDKGEYLHMNLYVMVGENELAHECDVYFDTEQDHIDIDVIEVEDNPALSAYLNTMLVDNFDFKKSLIQDIENRIKTESLYR